MSTSGGRKVLNKETKFKFQRQTKFNLHLNFKKSLKLKPPTAKSLNIDIDYKFLGNVQKMEEEEELINVANNGIEKYHERLRVGPSIKNSNARIKYSRDLTEILKSVTNIIYVENARFRSDLPFNAQYYRFEVDESDKKIPISKCGLCPYCPDTKFFCVRNGAYGSHLMLSHGIFPNNYLTPEGLNYGDYLMKTSDINCDLIQGYGLECAECHEIIRVGKLGKKLLPYFRHWKNNHRKVKMNTSAAKITKKSRKMIENRKKNTIS